MILLSDVLEGQTKEIIKRLSPNVRNWLEYIATLNETFLFDIVYERLIYFRYMSENERNARLQEERKNRYTKEIIAARLRSLCDSTNDWQ